MDVPSLRAMALRGTVELIAQLPEAAAIHRRIPPQVKEAIDRATGLSWVPLNYTIIVAEAVHAVLGREKTMALNRRSGVRFSEDSFSKGIVTGAMKIARMSPKLFLRANVATWNIISKNCGPWVLRDPGKPNEMDMVWSDVPPQLLVSEPAIHSFSDSLDIIYTIMGIKGTIEPVVSRSDATITFHFKW